ncbi:glycoside hydrolase family 38 C-terminal domain-containing protein [Fulvivirga ligni]|uniref:glycoside hydrolase family 38 C-terminal domain-containing protein n=1 Tax=Fulvivirga ligni TaxID=2904246 RepID=UPI001F24C509|nr:glycoside hydrolase family 38 C-terminal domain-containing protein [Fulvivirga ligni]UII19547.1 hypothetical protein LVD16_17040 [Fulvivirga ligni]
MKIRWLLLIVLFPQIVLAQQAYFVDGYHGGIYGHYPRWQTHFMVEKLKAHPDWKINLEIEPETWDSVKVYDPEAYVEFQQAMKNPELSERIDIVNPAYGQAYLYNISGESIIRQFDLGIRRLNEHFPGFSYTTYSSEEPCFTSALPQILKSFGFKNAVLKNPNTCWGGYVQNYGGELVGWEGPDKTMINTVTRYESEAFEKNSTWQTTAWGNSDTYVKAALAQGIEHPVGMCLQDAGWKGGPWLGIAKSTYRPSQYVTWTDYFEDYAVKQPTSQWDFSQEDIKVSLVWGAQVLQRIAQQVRTSENKITMAEKASAFSKATHQTTWPQSRFDEAWRTILLSQHHDCWIVPYNGRKGDTWADKVVDWTHSTNAISDSVTQQVLGAAQDIAYGEYIKIFNTQAVDREDVIRVNIQPDWNKNVLLTADDGQKTPAQVITAADGSKQLVFVGKVKPFGMTYFKVEKLKQESGEHFSNNESIIETAFYKLTLDPTKGGVITSLVDKKNGNKELVDLQSQRAFNELRGHFYEQNKLISSKDHPAEIEVVNDGPVLTTIAVKGHIDKHPFTQWITLYQSDGRIDFELDIDWQGSPGIGKYSQMEEYEAKDPKKAFYNDEYKLLVHFPLAFDHQKIYKNAPFDVTESRLQSTFFDRWDSIKNNVILNWVDVMDGDDNQGVALFTDHTTSYAHADDHPLALNVQYSGRGLWGRNYSLEGHTHMKYAIVPHQQKWDKAGIWMQSVAWNESLPAQIISKKANDQSLINFENQGWELISVQYDQDLLVRVFNAEGNEEPQNITLNGDFDEIKLVALNGEVLETLPIKDVKGQKTVSLSIPHFGIRTLKIKGFKSVKR